MFKKIQLAVGKLPLFKEKRGRLLYFLLLLLLPLMLLAVRKTQELRRKAQEVGTVYRVELAAHYNTSRPMEIGHQYAFSALVFGPDNQPVFEGFDYSWSISSNNSIGHLDRTTGKITNFIAENDGSGHLIVIATPINSIGNDEMIASVRLIVGDINEPDFRIELSYDCPLEKLKINQQCDFSALVYGPNNQPALDQFDYTWSISSDNSIGYLTNTQGPVTSFISQKSGLGYITVTARLTEVSSPAFIQKTVKVVVGEDFSRTCNQPCQNDDNCEGELICWHQQTPTPPGETNCTNDNDCFWRGRTCAPKTYEDPCPMIMPPEEWDCICQNNQCITVKNNEPQIPGLCRHPDCPKNTDCQCQDPTPTPAPDTSCDCEGPSLTERQRGDYNCKDGTTLSDLTLWVNCYFWGDDSSSCDYNCDGAANMGEYTTWWNWFRITLQ